MKNFKLIELNLKNFKGIKEFSLQAEGNNMEVRGKNASGKTTIFDAFVWLLFGKDSMNRSKFEIKALDEKGNVKQHGLDHEVEGQFKLEGKSFSLKRIYSEEWTKKRGSANQVFTGHTTDYFIDGVPVKKKDYTEKVNEIVSEDVFKLLTSPTYFNEQLDWKKRREILIEMTGELSDQEVAERSDNKDLEKLIAKLNGRSTEDHKLIINEKRKEINEELDKIPVRIDELQLSIPDISELDKTELQTKITNVNKDIELKNGEINGIKSGAEISNKQKNLSDIELELTKIKNNHGYETNQKIHVIKASIQESESNINILTREVDNDRNMVKNNENSISFINETVQGLRKAWATENVIEFEYESIDQCPTCTQSLPSDQVEEARNKALESFNKDKSEKLESIQKQAVAKKDEIEQLEASNKKMETRIDKLNKEIESSKLKKGKLEKDLAELQENVSDVSENLEYVAKMEQKENIEKEIIMIKESTEESIESVQMVIDQLEPIKNEAQDGLNKIELAERSDKRMKELDDQEKNLTAENEKLEHEMYLLEEFIRSKVNLLEDKINSKFKHAKFKLFEQQMNGGLRETCETTFGGVPYNSGLNNASRINIGLDIINTLNEHYGVFAPIFIDNSEAVIELENVEAQTIGLSVANLKNLKVELKSDSTISA